MMKRMREGETSAPHQSGPGGFSRPYACLMTFVRISSQPTSSFSSVSCGMPANRPHCSKKVRAARMLSAVQRAANSRGGGVVACAAGEILSPTVHDQVEGACVRPIVGFKEADQPVTGKLAARDGDGLRDAIGMHEPVRAGGQRDR